MQYKDMEEVDLKLSLLSGGDIIVDSFEIKPYILREIKDYGYTKYIKNLQLVFLSIYDFIDSVEDIESKMYLKSKANELKPFDFYMELGGKELCEDTIGVLSMILRTNDLILLDGKILVDFVKKGIIKYNEDGTPDVDDNKVEPSDENEIKIIHRDNFDDIIRVVKLQNYLEKPIPKEDLNPADEEVRKLHEHMKKMREKVENAKRQQQESNGDDREVDISDIVSAVSSKSNSINKLNIWDFTLYQIYDEYARLELIDNYDFSIKAMMAGAKMQDSLKHWSSKL